LAYGVVGVPDEPMHQDKIGAALWFLINQMRAWVVEEERRGERGNFTAEGREMFLDSCFMTCWMIATTPGSSKSCTEET